MAYLTVEQLKGRASKKNINLSVYTDEELAGKIMNYQTLIEERTGRIFEQRSVTEHFPRHDGSSIQLRYFPVLPNITNQSEYPSDGPYVDNLTMDGMTITWYYLYPEVGMIIFDMPIFNWGPYRVNNFTVTYTAVYSLDNPSGVHPEAQSLCSDMVLHSVTQGRTHGVTDMTIFEDRLRALTRPLMEVAGT